MSTGIFGGSFNPIHVGHLLIAREVLEALSLKEIVFVPAGQPWMKASDELAAPTDRARMVELAIAGDPDFRSSRVEVDRPGETYTVDTLRQLGKGTRRPVLILGADAMEKFPEWHQATEVAEQARIVVVGRPGTELLAIIERVRDRVAALDAKALHTALVEVSGTDIRKRIRDDKSIRNLTPPAVAEYISTHGLYRRPGPKLRRGGKYSTDKLLARLKEIEEEKAVLRGTFTLSSGATSTYYFDGRKATYDPEGAAIIGALVEALLEDEVRAIGGPATAASPIITATQLVAYHRGRTIDGFYVRGDAKKHGTKSLIEGNLPEHGGSVVVVDDTMTTGRSLLHTIEAVEAAGCKVARVVVIVDRCEGGREALREKGHDVVALLTADNEGSLT